MFGIVLLLVLLRRNAQTTTLVGLISLLVAIPLSASWVFFTAHRLMMYAGAFFATAIVQDRLSVHRKGASV